MTILRLSVRAAIATAMLIVVAAGAPAQTIDGFRTFEHPTAGLSFKYPQDFKSVPTQPTEELIIARFVREEPYLARKADRNRRPESFAVFVLKPQTTGVAAASDPPRSHEEAVARANAITGLDLFLKSRYGEVKLVPLAAGLKAKKGYDEWKMTAPVRGYVYTREAGGRTVGVVGFADEEVYDAMSKRFRTVGQTLRKSDGDKALDQALEYYDDKDFRDPGFRAAVRAKLLKGWQARDTENFLIISNSDNAKMVSKIAADLEAIRPLYMTYFQPVKEIEAVSVVRICKDFDEYRRYGGPQGSGGYWNPVAKELVFFDYAKVPKSADTNSRHADERDAYIVLYHEAFHQYIYYAAGEIAPHSWFNEGLGDVFSGTVIYTDSLRVKEVGLNRWRIHVVREANETDKWIPLAELFKAEQHEYYNREKVRWMYAEGWSLCYFLMIAKDGAQDNPEWRSIIPDYFAELKRASDAKVKALPKEAKIGERMEAEKAAREQALKFALEGVDVDALETAWRAWIKKTKDPWVATRKT